MFTFEEWCNPLSEDFPDVARIKNVELFKVVFNEYLDRGNEPSDIPVTVAGFADIFDGVPMPSLWVQEDQSLEGCETLEELYSSIYCACGYAASRVYGPSSPTKVTYTGTAYVVQSIGSLDEGFPDLRSALEYCATLN